MHKALLKVKVKHLAAEARIIRLEERKKKAQARYARSKDRSKAGDGIDLVRERLHLHRVGTLRREARDSHLAYAFIRGREYRDVERTMKTPPNWENVGRMVKKYGQVELPPSWYES